MRLNKYIAVSTGMSRRAADEVIGQNRVSINGEPVRIGRPVEPGDEVIVDGEIVRPPETHTTILFNKPVGYVCSRDGQGSSTIYELLPEQYHSLKPVGRLDKDSSGLLLLTDDGQLAFELTHPSRQKVKVYEVKLNKALAPLHRQMISDHGIMLDDGVSKLQLERITDGDDFGWRVTMHEGRNHQIRRTFAALGYTVTALRRTHFGSYTLSSLPRGEHKVV